MITDEITTKLFSLQDTAYRDFQVKLIPGMDAQKEIGVRTPELRKLSKELAKREDIREFLNDLPHQYFDENQLHAFILSGEKDFEKCMEDLERFLPYVDNWATCDQSIFWMRILTQSTRRWWRRFGLRNIISG